MEIAITEREKRNWGLCPIVLRCCCHCCLVICTSLHLLRSPFYLPVTLSAAVSVARCCCCRSVYVISFQLIRYFFSTFAVPCFVLSNCILMYCVVDATQCSCILLREYTNSFHQKHYSQ